MKKTPNEIFQEYLKLMLEGKEVTPEEIIRRYPEHKEFLLRKIAALEMLPFSDSGPSYSKDLSGTVIDDFKIIKEIGKGGMGNVYLAEQLSLNRKVALKILRQSIFTDEMMVERFRQEGRAIAKLQHKGIVPVYLFGEQEGSFYIAMQYVEGLPLSKLIDYAKENELTSIEPDQVRDLIAAEFPEDERTSIYPPPGRNWTEMACKIMAGVAEAVEYAHQRKILHRDIKPSNIILTKDGQPVLFDFGLSKDMASIDLTPSGEFLGTPSYCAPEQLFSKHPVHDAKTDVYSLGMTLYELLTFNLPYEGGSVGDLISAIKSKDPTRPVKFNNTISKDLDTVILKAICKDPSKRYQNVAKLGEELEQFVNLPTRKTEMTYRKRRRKSIMNEIYGKLLHRNTRYIIASVLIAVLCASGIICYLVYSLKWTSITHCHNYAIEQTRIDDSSSKWVVYEWNREILHWDPSSPYINISINCDNLLSVLSHTIMGLQLIYSSCGASGCSSTSYWFHGSHDKSDIPFINYESDWLDPPKLFEKQDDGSPVYNSPWYVSSSFESIDLFLCKATAIAIPFYICFMHDEFYDCNYKYIPDELHELEQFISHSAMTLEPSELEKINILKYVMLSEIMGSSTYRAKLRLWGMPGDVVDQLLNELSSDLKYYNERKSYSFGKTTFEQMMKDINIHQPINVKQEVETEDISPELKSMLLQEGKTEKEIQEIIWWSKVLAFTKPGWPDNMMSVLLWWEYIDSHSINTQTFPYVVGEAKKRWRGEEFVVDMNLKGPNVPASERAELGWYGDFLNTNHFPLSSGANVCIAEFTRYSDGQISPTSNCSKWLIKLLDEFFQNSPEYKKLVLPLK